MIKEYDKVKLKTGEIARISEVLEDKVAYIADIFTKDGHISIEQIGYADIFSVFEEVEHTLAQTM